MTYWLEASTPRRYYCTVIAVVLAPSIPKGALASLLPLAVLDLPGLCIVASPYNNAIVVRLSRAHLLDRSCSLVFRVSATMIFDVVPTCPFPAGKLRLARDCSGASRLWQLSLSEYHHHSHCIILLALTHSFNHFKIRPGRTGNISLPSVHEHSTILPLSRRASFKPTRLHSSLLAFALILSFLLPHEHL